MEPINTTVDDPRSIHEMTDREIAEETLYWLRYAGQALAEMQRGGIGKLMTGMFTRNGNG